MKRWERGGWGDGKGCVMGRRGSEGMHGVQGFYDLIFFFLLLIGVFFLYFYAREGVGGCLL